MPDYHSLDQNYFYCSADGWNIAAAAVAATAATPAAFFAPVTILGDHSRSPGPTLHCCFPPHVPHCSALFRPLAGRTSLIWTHCVPLAPLAREATVCFQGPLPPSNFFRVLTHVFSVTEL